MGQELNKAWHGVYPLCHMQQLPVLRPDAILQDWVAQAVGMSPRVKSWNINFHPGLHYYHILDVRAVTKKC